MYDLPRPPQSFQEGKRYISVILMHPLNISGGGGKKYFISRVPLGVSINLFCTDLLIVEICRFVILAIFSK